ncbi:hypothetical protein NP493_21g08032 [Ridgeia piscesae]|uniref:Uncharacterized protein n=1 Tax=Ridgeia piscesae TaxID=27915 RepID=A0AAD9UKS0_RIDPI|nr:hypothetical protein NP493_21g08032 [Ridgeia piscesae]
MRLFSVQQMLLPPPNPKDNPKDHKEHPMSAPVNNENIILLVDQYLMQLPLEALQLLQMNHVSSVSREISLQMIFNKMHSGPSAEELEEKGKKEKGVDKTKPPPRLPGLRDANKKQVKIIPLERPVPAGILPVDTNSFRYIVDPHLDCSETEVKKPVEVFNNMLEEHSQQFTPRWLGILGNEHTPSQGEYEIYLAECGAFVFYGMERFLGYIPPHKVAATNMPDCQLMVLLDQTQTSSSFSRQAKIDVHKTTDRLALEKPVETAMLLGLAGVNCVLINQWHCSLQDNAEKLDILMKELLAGGKTTGHAVHTLLVPPKMKEDNEVADEGAEKPKVDEGSRRNSHDSNASVGPVMNRQRANLVCYGLPNIIVAQLSKV